MIGLINTLGNPQWLKENEVKLKSIFPNNLTSMRDLNLFQIGFKLKLYGVDWRSEEELIKSIVFLEKVGIIIRANKDQIMANPNKVF